MKAVAVFPGKPNSIHLTDLPEPEVDDILDGRGVLVEVLRVGVDGTDKEINDAEYGDAPEGYNFLVIGHESFGRVLEVGPNVRGLEPGDYVVATVRRPGTSIYDHIGTYDTTTDETYYERGINLLHGYLTERYVDDPEYLVRVPAALKDIGVLLEPTSRERDRAGLRDPAPPQGLEAAARCGGRRWYFGPPSDSNPAASRLRGHDPGPHRASHAQQRAGGSSRSEVCEHP